MIDRLIGGTNAAPAASSAKLKDSARQFEALMIGQMLKSARESGGSWFGGGEDEASSTATGMAEEQLAQTLAASGGLGLTSMVLKGLQMEDREGSQSGRLKSAPQDR
jgi:Rod binding domain-containing protein